MLPAAPARRLARDQAAGGRGSGLASARQQRSERREGCLALLGALLTVDAVASELAAVARITEVLLRYAQSRAVIALGALIAGFAAVSALARSIGIVRWLVPAPELAEAYVAATDETERTAISVVFDSMNA